MSLSAPLLCSPFGIQLRDRRRNGKVPDKNADVLIFLRNHIKISSLCRRHSRFVHLLRLLFYVVEKRAEERNSFLATDRSVSGHKHRVLVPRSERLPSFSPAGRRGLRVESTRTQSGQQQIPC